MTGLQRSIQTYLFLTKSQRILFAFEEVNLTSIFLIALALIIRCVILIILSPILQLFTLAIYMILS